MSRSRILGAVVLLMFAFAITVVLTSVQHAIAAWVPFADNVVDALNIYRYLPAIALFATNYILFYLSRPPIPKERDAGNGRGAADHRLWLATVEVRPEAIGLLGGYDLTYGSLAGVMVVLIFFFMVGLGVVAGAESMRAGGSFADGAKGRSLFGSYKDQLEVEEPQPGEDVDSCAIRGPQL